MSAFRSAIDAQCRDTLARVRGAIESALRESKAGSCAVVFDAASRSALESLCVSLEVDLLGELECEGATLITTLDAAAELDWTQAGPVIFVTRPHVSSAKRVAGHVKLLLSRRFSGKVHNIVLPRRSYAYEQTLRDQGVWHAVRDGMLAVHQGFIPLGADVFSLELDGVLREAKAEGDLLSASTLSRALADMHHFSGVARIRSKGALSKTVLDGFIRILREDDDAAEPFEPEPLRVASEKGGPLDASGALPRPSSFAAPATAVVDTLVVLDRDTDMISPLCTPLTYEALLDDVFGIVDGRIVVEGRVLGEEGKVTVDLRKDSLFASIRDVHMGHIMEALNRNARQQKEVEEQARRERDVDVMLKVVKLLPKIQSDKRELEIHIKLAKYLHALLLDRRRHRRRLAERAAVEGDHRALLECAHDSAARGESLPLVARQLVLASVLAGGLSNVDAVRQELVHAYGLEAMTALDRMDRLGLLAYRDRHGQVRGRAEVGPAFAQWATVRKALRLMDDDGGDAAYVFSGQAPVSVRLVELALQGWEAHVDVLRALAGPTLCDVVLPGRKVAAQAHARRLVVVVYVGGVCLAEVAALRCAARRADVDVLVATTKVITGTSLLQTLMERS